MLAKTYLQHTDGNPTLNDPLPPTPSYCQESVAWYELPAVESSFACSEEPCIAASSGSTLQSLLPPQSPWRRPAETAMTSLGSIFSQERIQYSHCHIDNLSLTKAPFCGTWTYTYVHTHTHALNHCAASNVSPWLLLSRLHPRHQSGLSINVPAFL